MNDNYNELIDEITKGNQPNIETPIITLNKRNKRLEKTVDKRNFAVYAPVTFMKRIKTLISAKWEIGNFDAPQGDLIILAMEVLTSLFNKLKKSGKEFNNIDEVQDYIEYLIEEKIKIE